MADEESESIKDFLRRTGCSLLIKRMPYNDEKAFKLLANKEFEGDYGFTLKHLLNFYQGLIPTGWEHLETVIDILDKRVTKLEGEIKKKEKGEEIKMGNGKVIRRKE
jgi:hypothetical protein